MTEPERPARRIRLTGARFAGGRLPIDSLVELERYQELLRLVARSEWEAAHANELLPAGFDDDVSLTIDRIEEGSADIFLVFEQHSAFVEYQERADDVVNEAIAAAYESRDLPSFPAAIESQVIEQLTSLGQTLEPGQAIEVYTTGPSAVPVTIDQATRREVIDQFALDAFVNATFPDPQRELESRPETVVGRITELDADKATYRFESLQYGRLIGHYDPARTTLDDIREVLNSPSDAPILRVEGLLQHRRDGRPWRFTETHVVEQFAAGTEPWAPRLVELAQLATGWGEAGVGDAIALVALEAANSILAACAEFGVVAPGIFPAEDAGVLLEWATLQRVRSVEITSNGEFELFDKPADESATLRLTANLQEAFSFVREVPS